MFLGPVVKRAMASDVDLEGPPKKKINAVDENLPSYSQTLGIYE
jgi:hypothetical protein